MPDFSGGLRCDRIVAPCITDGPINAAGFRAHEPVRQLVEFAEGRNVPRLSPAQPVADISRYSVFRYSIRARLSGSLRPVP
jgi:hypothetical protein